MSGPSEFSRSVPAFPRSIPFEGSDTALGIAMTSGMTLRDYFAAKALVGLLSYIAPTGRVNAVGKIGQFDEVGLAHTCFVLADAMLAEREKP